MDLQVSWSWRIGRNNNWGLKLIPHSSFTGSAGTALIPAAGSDAKALLFIDSRYWQQGEEQAPKKNWKVVRVGATGTGSGGRNEVAGGWVDYVVSVSRDMYQRLMIGTRGCESRYRPQAHLC